MNEGLNPIERIALQMIVAAARDGREAPSNAEIATRAGLSSSGTASAVVARLERLGVIRVERFHSRRAIEIVESGESTPRPPANERGKPNRRKPGFREILGDLPGTPKRHIPLTVVLTYRPDPPPPKDCQWLDGEPGERRFCGKPTTMRPDGIRSAYCAHHHRRCYLRGSESCSFE